MYTSSHFPGFSCYKEGDTICVFSIVLLRCPVARPSIVTKYYPSFYTACCSRVLKLFRLPPFTVSLSQNESKTVHSTPFPHQKILNTVNLASLSGTTFLRFPVLRSYHLNTVLSSSVTFFGSSLILIPFHTREPLTHSLRPILLMHSLRRGHDLFRNTF